MELIKNLCNAPEAADEKSVAADPKHFIQYEEYKNAHRELVLIDRHQKHYEWRWKSPVVVTVQERLDRETVRRFQLFVARLKQNSSDEYFLTGYSFASKTERSLFLFESNPEAALIHYQGQEFTPGNLFYRLKEQIFAPEP